MAEINNSIDTLLPQLAYDNINTWSEEFEKNNIARETPDQVAKHLATILRAYNIRGILADHLVSKKEIHGIESVKLTEYEMGYLYTGGSYLFKLYPQKFQAMIQEETGMKDIHQFMNTMSVELPDGRKKSLRLVLIEQSHKNSPAGIIDSRDIGVNNKSTTTKIGVLKKDIGPKIAEEKVPVLDKKSPTINQDLVELERKQGKDFFTSLEELFKKMTPEQKRDFTLTIFAPGFSLMLHAKEAYAELNTDQKKVITNEMINLFTGVIPGVKLTQIMIEKVLG